MENPCPNYFCGADRKWMNSNEAVRWSWQFKYLILKNAYIIEFKLDGSDPYLILHFYIKRVALNCAREISLLLCTWVFLMVVDFSVDSCFGGWNVLWTLFKYIWLWTLFKYIRENVKKSFWHWIQLLLDRWLYRRSALSPKNTWQLSWCLWDVRQYGAAGALCSTAGGLYTSLWRSHQKFIIQKF